MDFLKSMKEIIVDLSYFQGNLMRSGALDRSLDFYGKRFLRNLSEQFSSTIIKPKD